MAFQFRRISHASVVALIGGLALSACGQNEAEAPVASADVAPEPAVSVVDSLAPDALMLRALECRSSLAPVRNNTDRLPADVAERVANTANVSFGDLVLAADRYDISMEARRDAHQGGRSLPATAAEVTPEYIDYVKTCADVLDRAASVLAEAKAAQP